MLIKIYCLKKISKILLEGLLGVSSSTIFKGKGYIQLKTEDDIDKVYEPGVYAIKGTSYNDQTLLVFSHNLGQSTVQFRTNNYGGFLVFRIKWWNGGWGTWKTVSLTHGLVGINGGGGLGDDVAGVQIVGHVHDGHAGLALPVEHRSEERL